MTDQDIFFMKLGFICWGITSIIILALLMTV
jgi:hypothetical protein